MSPKFLLICMYTVPLRVLMAYMICSRVAGQQWGESQATAQLLRRTVHNQVLPGCALLRCQCAVCVHVHHSQLTGQSLHQHACHRLPPCCLVYARPTARGPIGLKATVSTALAAGISAVQKQAAPHMLPAAPGCAAATASAIHKPQVPGLTWPKFCASHTSSPKEAEIFVILSPGCGAGQGQGVSISGQHAAGSIHHGFVHSGYLTLSPDPAPKPRHTLIKPPCTRLHASLGTRAHALPSALLLLQQEGEGTVAEQMVAGHHGIHHPAAFGVSVPATALGAHACYSARRTCLLQR
jgi:hypothetical protein